MDITLQDRKESLLYYRVDFRTIVQIRSYLDIYIVITNEYKEL
jgi:hypothetical protein